MGITDPLAGTFDLHYIASDYSNDFEWRIYKIVQSIALHKLGDHLSMIANSFPIVQSIYIF